MKDKKTIIQLLKDNWVPFGGWPEFYGEEIGKEMQKNAIAIGFHGNFRLYVHPGFGGIIDNVNYAYDGCLTYRLRPDYEEEPEIVECEITEADGHLHFKYTTDDGMRHAIHQACDHPDFIGFKFEDGGILQYPVRYITPATKFTVNCPSLDTLDAYDIWHATHVLFRRPK